MSGIVVGLRWLKSGEARLSLTCNFSVGPSENGFGNFDRFGSGFADQLRFYFR